MCEGATGVLVQCDGDCLRSFHTGCCGLNDEVPEGDWYCENCLSQEVCHSTDIFQANFTTQFKCFYCKKADKVGEEFKKCKLSFCGKYYHLKCIKSLPLKDYHADSRTFICPRHFCTICTNVQTPEECILVTLLTCVFMAIDYCYSCSHATAALQHITTSVPKREGSNTISCAKVPAIASSSYAPHVGRVDLQNPLRNRQYMSTSRTKGSRKSLFRTTAEARKMQPTSYQISLLSQTQNQKLFPRLLLPKRSLRLQLRLPQ